MAQRFGFNESIVVSSKKHSEPRRICAFHFDADKVVH